jgi:hypothetical protein
MKYVIRFWQDDEYVVYREDNIGGEYLFKGTLEEVNAWVSLKEKGYDF